MSPNSNGAAQPHAHGSSQELERHPQQNQRVLDSDTIEVQDAYAHTSPTEHDIVNLDGTAESTPLSDVVNEVYAQMRQIFPNDISATSVPPPHVSKTPAPNTQSLDHLDQASTTNKQELPLNLESTQSGELQNRDSLPAPTPSAPQNILPGISTPPPPPPPPQGYFGTMKMDLSGPDTVDAHNPNSSPRRLKKYLLPNGSVVSGKGLGRGRPGIKRGPRRPKTDETGRSVSTPGSMSGSALATPSSEPTASKRRRTDSDTHKSAMTPESDSMLSDARDSSPEYNPTGETRSGRKIKPIAGQIPIPESASPASKRPKLDSRNTAPVVSPAAKMHPKIKRRLYRGREQLALCEHCQRGHGPVGNNIVFCDACNRCWHQRCHEPQVPQSVIADTKAEWYCANCEKILHGKKGKKAKATTSSSAAAKVQVPSFVGPLVGGAALSAAHKLAFLQSRSKEQLISLILSGSDLAPALPMFQAPAPQLPQAQFKSDYITPVTSLAGLRVAAAAADADDEGYDSYFDEHAALYPKPGNGLKLPPESADVHMLLEHSQSKTFSHWIRGMPTREFSGNADVVFQR